MVGVRVIAIIPAVPMMCVGGGVVVPIPIVVVGCGSGVVPAVISGVPASGGVVRRVMWLSVRESRSSTGQVSRRTHARNSLSFVFRFPFSQPLPGFILFVSFHFFPLSFLIFFLS